MLITVEMSFYPFAEQYIPAIKNTVSRLNNAEHVKVKTNATATHIVGEYDAVMTLVSKEIKMSFEEVGKSVFVCKFINSELAI